MNWEDKNIRPRTDLSPKEKEKLGDRLSHAVLEAAKILVDEEE